MKRESSSTSRIRIRRAIPADVPAMISLEQATPSAAHWSKKTYEEIFDLSTTPRTALAAELNGAVYGFVIARITADQCELENIVVAEVQRRKGTGHMLLRALIAAAREKNAAHLLLEVRESNHAARRLYESYGFTLSSRRKNYYSIPTEDAITYTLPL